MSWQFYDNSSNMAEQYSGLQKRINDKNESALFIPCAGHSLNLVGNSATDYCLQEIIFLISFYNFFSASTHCWQVLLFFVGNGKKIVKQLSGTRWSRADAVKCLHKSYNEIKKALESLIKDRSQTKEIKNEAQNLIMKMKNFFGNFVERHSL